MSLHELVDTMFEHKIASQDEDGQAQIDLTNMDQVAFRLKQVRRQASALKKEDEKLKKAILAHPDSKAGFSNADIEIKGGEQLDLENPALIQALMETKTYQDAGEFKLIADKVKEIALKHPAVAAAMKYDKTRKVYVAGE